MRVLVDRPAPRRSPWAPAAPCRRILARQPQARRAHEDAVEPPRIGIDQQLVGIEVIALVRIVGTVGAQAIARARRRCPRSGRDGCCPRAHRARSGSISLVQLVEERHPDAPRRLGIDGEIDALGGDRRAELVGAAAAAGPVLVSSMSRPQVMTLGASRPVRSPDSGKLLGERDEVGEGGLGVEVVLSMRRAHTVRDRPATSRRPCRFRRAARRSRLPSAKPMRMPCLALVEPSTGS